MKILKKKGFCNKLIIVLLAIIIVNMLIPMHEVKASDYDVGGVLLQPIVSLVLKIGDGIVDLIHKVIYGTSTALLEYNVADGWWKILIIIGVAVVTILITVFLVTVALPAMTGVLSGIAAKLAIPGAAALINAGASAAVGTIVKLTLGAGVIAGMYIACNWYGDVVVLPIYQISPQEIFAGEVEFLNANFFTTEIQEEEEEEVIEEPEITVDSQRTNIQTVDTYYTRDVIYYGSKPDEAERIINEKLRNNGYTGEEIKLAVIYSTTPADSIAEGLPTKWVKDNKIYEATIIKTHGGDNPSFQGNDAVYRLTFKITSADPYFPPSSGQAKPAEPIINSLKPTVARWYYALRTFAIILMMTELVYIGIRMMLCSVASEKAKYKNMLKDWVIAICLLFLMHYIMAFSNIMVDSFTKVVNTLSGEKSYTVYINDNEKKIQEALKKDIDKLQLDETIPDLEYLSSDGNGNLINSKGEVVEKGIPEGTNILIWNASNIMGLARIQAQIQGNDVAGVWYIGYTIAFLALVFYTCYFLFVYIKRLVYLSFLTMISPLVAFTYPIDKINDGKAQAFDMWFKEYIFNLLIQPFHLILYTVLITSAFDLAVENILYTLVAIGFLMPAEKLLRKFFGFEKAQTPGMLGGAAGAALVMGGMNKLLHKRPHKELGDGDNGGKIKEKDNLEDFKAKDDIDDSVLFGNQSPSLKDSTRVNNDKSESDGGLKPVRLGTEGIEFGEGESNPIDESVIRKNFNTGETDYVENKARVKTNIPNSSTNKVSNNRFKNNAKGVMAYAKAYAKYKARGIPKGFAKGTKKFVRKMPKMAAGAALGIGAGMIGATVGIASGDFGNTFKYAGAGMAGGYALGSSLINPNEKEKERLKQEYQRAYYGNEVEYKKAKLEEQRNKYMKDEDNIRAIQNYLNCDEKTAKQVLEKNSDCLDKGIIDPRDIATIEKAISEGWEKNTAVKAVQTLSKSGKAPSKMNKDEEENWNHQARKIVEKAGYSGANADAAVKNLNKRLDDIYKIKDNLTKI